MTHDKLTNMQSLSSDVSERTIKEMISKTIDPVLKSDLKETYVAMTRSFDHVSDKTSATTSLVHKELYNSHVESFNHASAVIDSIVGKIMTSGELSQENSVAFRATKFREQLHMNASYLHELYFENSFDNASEAMMDSLAFMRLQRDWGSFEMFQADFMACAAAAAQGWAVTAYSFFLRRYHNFVVESHDMRTLVGIYPIIVQDMHEHAYIRDYRNDRDRFIIDQMRTWNWIVIEDRFRRAEIMAEAMR